MGFALPAASLPVRKALLLAQKVRVELGKSDNGEKHMILHTAINGHAVWQSGTEGLSSGQHGISSGIADTVAAVITAAFTGAVNGPTTRPTIARTGSSLRSQAMTIIEFSMPQVSGPEKPVSYPRLESLSGAGCSRSELTLESRRIV
jgi:hypothetical protein